MDQIINYILLASYGTDEGYWMMLIVCKFGQFHCCVHLYGVRGYHPPKSHNIVREKKWFLV